ncbi:MAG: sulfatase-like hydrolase/transferase [Planctomycetes bacterium]|nr:sulfatase-like hydrolase/transferase [Planctomycetota bacterium]
MKRNYKDKISRREFLKKSTTAGLAAGLSASVWISGCGRAQQKKKPNIIFILADTLRADHLPSYGYKVNTAPKIHQLAQRGVVFERVIAPSTWTKTSMASIMTSTDPHRHGVKGVNDVLSTKKLTTLAQGLKDNGYHTICVNTNTWLSPKFGFNAGFDDYQMHPLVSKQSFASAWDINSKTVDLLGQISNQQPTFLYLHYMDIHAPYAPKPPFFSAPPLDIPGLGIVTNSKLETLFRQNILNSPEVVERVIDLYDGEIRTFDAAIDQLLKQLQGMGWLDNTIVVITSDHGEEFLEHGRTEHGKDIYPETYEVPLIFLWPGHLSAGEKIKTQVRSIDIAPTLFELAGLTAPQSFEGISLLPMKDDALQNRLALSAVGLNDRIPNLDYIAVVSPQHLYIREKINNMMEFYDLQLDSAAKYNLGTSHPKVSYYANLEKNIITAATEQTELDPQTIKQLKSLGYLQ